MYFSALGGTVFIAEYTWKLVSKNLFKTKEQHHYTITQNSHTPPTPSQTQTSIEIKLQSTAIKFDANPKLPNVAFPQKTTGDRL